MIEELVSASPSRSRLKILYADKDILDRLPPIRSSISFKPFIQFLKDKIVATSGTQSAFYKYLIKKFEAEPALLDQVMDGNGLSGNEELLELLSTAIFPVVSEKNNFTLSTPYQFSIFSYSD